MEKQFTNKINIAAGSILLEDILRSRLTDAVSGMSKMHPMMKMYFDSELNSDIERQTLLTITDAILKTTGMLEMLVGRLEIFPVLYLLRSISIQHGKPRGARRFQSR